MQEKEALEITRKFNIDLKALEQEQKKLAKALELKDSFDPENIITVAGVDVISLGSKMIVGIVIIEEGEIIEQKFCTEKASFPYISGFRAYRELPAIISCFETLENKPQLIFIKGHGISHPRRLGIASHLSVSINLPVIGVADELMVGGGEVEKDNILLDGKVVGKIVYVKKGARPLYVSPGNLISVETAAEFVKEFVKEPHKMPEPLRLARNLVKKVMGEFY